MKKRIIYFILIGVILLYSCKKKPEYENITEPFSFNIEEFSSNNSAVWKGDILPDAESSVKMAKLIVQQCLQIDPNEYPMIRVGYDDQRAVWTIMFYKDTQTVGGGINIALSQKSGEILLIWFDE